MFGPVSGSMPTGEERDGAAGAARATSPGVPAALAGESLDGVVQAWSVARREANPWHPELARALGELADVARERRLDVTVLLQTLSAVAHAGHGGRLAPDVEHLRECAGVMLIRAYYRDGTDRRGIR